MNQSYSSGTRCVFHDRHCVMVRSAMLPQTWPAVLCCYDAFECRVSLLATILHAHHKVGCCMLCCCTAGKPTAGKVTLNNARTESQQRKGLYKYLSKLQGNRVEAWGGTLQQ